MERWLRATSIVSIPIPNITGNCISFVGTRIIDLFIPMRNSLRMLFRSSRFVVLLLLVADIASAQKATVGNSIVTATVDSSTGLIAIYKTGATPTNLTYPGTSYLSLKIDGRYYTNNASTPPTNLADPIGSIQSQSPDVLLDSGITTVSGNTIQTVWHDTLSGADIVQRVYPEEFASVQPAGQIVISVSLVSTQPHNVQGQYLIDDQTGIAQMPAILNSNSYDAHAWQLLSGAAVPSFFLELQGTPSSPGVEGRCYLNDTFAPQPMGLIPPSVVMHCDWDAAADYTFGAPASGHVGDMATLIQWPALAAKIGSTEVLRFSLGTVGSQGTSECVTSNLVAYNFLTTDIAWNDTIQDFQPNPFHVLTLLFNAGSTALANLTVHESHSQYIKTLSADTLSFASLAAGDIAVAEWIDTIVNAFGKGNQMLSVDIGADVAGVPVFSGCSNPIILEVPPPITHRPLAATIERTGSSDTSTCNARHVTKIAFDTGSPRVKIKSIAIASAQNMNVLLPPLPFGDTLRYSVNVADSMKDGFAVMLITDSGNVNYRDTTRYCTMSDLAAPQVFAAKNKEVVALDTGAWQRGIDTMFATDTANIVITPTSTGGCMPSATIGVHAIAPDAISRALIHVIDCAGNETKYAYFFAPGDGVAVEKQSTIRVYPNPASDFLTIELPEYPTSVEIVDALGRTVTTIVAQGLYHFDISEMRAGTYFIHVGASYLKLIKQ
jgi:hypothetical protein